MLAARLTARLGLLGGQSAARGWAAAFSTAVTVPPLGDSISEGSISAVLKHAGDRVAENDVIAQIETDKVTIDIKAPREGTLVGILVKVEDTVTPGQLIATVDESTASQGALFAPAAAAAASGGDAAAAAPAAAAAAAGPAGRVPGIRFPLRVTPDGQRISSLPAAEALQWLHPSRGGGGGSGGASAAAATAAAPAGGAARAAAPAAPVAAAPAASAPAGGRLKVSTTRLTHQPDRTPLSERELEAIMLGGALD